MMKLKHIVLLSSTTFGLLWSCKTPAVQVTNTPTPISKPKENQGFYQFLNDYVRNELLFRRFRNVFALLSAVF